MYDSTEDTLKHIEKVQGYLAECVRILKHRAENHDKSKLEEPEKSIFDQYTPILKDTPYGSEVYYEALKGMGPALAHHYEHNSHHPEHFQYKIQVCGKCDGEYNYSDVEGLSCGHCGGKLMTAIKGGIPKMSLFDLLEMLVDWKAASERHANGDIFQSLVLNQERFDIGNQLMSILWVTAKEMGWGDG